MEGTSESKKEKRDPKHLSLFIGKRLRYLRTKRCETMAIHKEISKKYNVSLSQSSYSKIERGEISAPLATLCALADYFDVDLSYLLDPPVRANRHILKPLLEDPELVDILEKLVAELGNQKTSSYLLTMLGSLLILVKEDDGHKSKKL